MITLIIIGCIIYVIVATKKANTPDDKDSAKVMEDISKIPDIYFYAQPMNGFNRFLNMSYDGSREIRFFGYSNGLVTIKMKNGQILRSHLKDMLVRFDKPKNYPVTVAISSPEAKVDFYEMTNLKEKEWETIYHILSLARTTYGTDIFKYSSLDKNLGRVNMILKLIQHLQ
ncbi:MAG: hypothetical protein NC411_08930 [Bacteroides sp.]|nr:hypothetical protein [Bacteroides sp.]